jgi:hypothetical protein
MKSLERVLLAAWLLASGCSGGAPTSSEEARLASAETTPAFRNLGKRGESALPSAPQSQKSL